METISREEFDRLTSDLFYEQKFDLVKKYMADTFVDHDPLPDQPAGTDGTIWKVKVFHTAFPDFRGANERVVVGDRHIVHEFRCEGTHDGAFLGMPPTGRSVVMRGIDILQFKDRLITDRWGVFDTFGLMQQLGMMGGGGGDWG